MKVNEKNRVVSVFYKQKKNESRFYGKMVKAFQKYVETEEVITTRLQAIVFKDYLCCRGCY